MPLTVVVIPHGDQMGAQWIRIRTCWRDECYSVIPWDTLGQKQQAVTGEAAAIRLIRTLLGLESFAVGESHIIRQVRACYDLHRGHCGPILHRLFQRAFGISRRLRSSLHPGRAPSIPYLAASVLKEHPLWGTDGFRCLVAGMGDMGRETSKVLSYFGASVTCTSRSSPPPPGFERIPWELLRPRAREFHGVFLCSASKSPVLLPLDLADSGVWLVDLGSPPQGAPGNGYRYFGIGEIALRAQSMLGDYRKELLRLEMAAEEWGGLLWSDLVSHYPALLPSGKTKGVSFKWKDLRALDHPGPQADWDGFCG